MLESDRRVDAINEFGKEAKGRRELLRHFGGERNTIRQMVLAKCYDCMGYFNDGKIDCEVTLCPLYPIMAYRGGEKYATKVLSDAHRKKLSAAMTKSKGNTLAIA